MERLKERFQKGAFCIYFCSFPVLVGEGGTAAKSFCIVLIGGGVGIRTNIYTYIRENKSKTKGNRKDFQKKFRKS